MVIENNLARIYEDLVRYLKNDTAQHGTNELLTGKWGMLLFIFYYEHYLDNTRNVASELLEKLYDQLDPYTDNYSFCTGITGPFWMLQHLQRHCIIDIDVKPLLTDLIKLTIQHSRYSLSMQNFDFLHGSVGICTFLVENTYDVDVRLHLAEFVQSLNKATVQTESGLSFPFFYYHTDPPSIPGTDAFSLAHGTCAIQILLLKIHRAGIEQTLCKDLIFKSMSFVLSHENTSEKAGSRFPGYLHDKSTQCRVSWCYGDLNVAVSLWRCGKYFGVDEWMNKSIKILKFNSKRIDKQRSGVVDGCLCHGAAGNAIIYMRMAEQMPGNDLQPCSDKWFDVLNQMIKFADTEDETGVLMYRGGEDKWQYEAGLLEGSAGVGIALLSQYVGYALPWDECLLLS